MNRISSISNRGPGDRYPQVARYDGSRALEVALLRFER
jgi:hypothetical protein